MTKPYPCFSRFYEPEHTEKDIKKGKKYTEPISDAYMEISFMNGTVEYFNAEDTCGAPAVTAEAIVVHWNLEDRDRGHATEVIPMHTVKRVISYPASAGFEEALDRYSIQETGMTYEESTKATRSAYNGASLDGFLQAIGVDPDSIDPEDFKRFLG